MGVRGLKSYLEKSVKFHGIEIELRGTKLIIDGHNLCNHLYKKNDLDCRCGGQYEEFYETVRLFFDALKSKGVDSYVVLDGAFDGSDKKLETYKERTQNRIDTAAWLFKNETSANDEKYFLLPLLAKFVFVEVLRDHEIKFAVSDCEADSDIASLANDWKCPVLSNDNDFFIFDVKGGFIPLSSFNVDQLTTRISYRCDLASNLGIREELLPLFASLVGNDYVSWEALKPFHCKIYTSASDGRKRKVDRFSDVKKFLSQFSNSITETKAFESAMGRVEPGESRERLEKAVKYSLQEYAIMKSNLLDYFRDGVVCSLLRTQNDHELDEELLRRFREGEISTDCMSSLTAGKVFLRVQVEDRESRSPNQCSMSLRQLMYGILSDGGRNMKIIEEWDREGFADIKPYNDKVPSFSSIPKLDPHVRLRMFLDALDSDSACIKSLPEELALVASSLRFLHRNSQPSLETSHLRALVCSWVKLEDGSWKQYLEHPTRALSQPFDERAAQSFCQWQCVLRDAIHLNFVLHKPIQTPCIRKTFNGKLVHRLQRELTTGHKPESLLTSSLARYHELYTAITADPEEKGIDPQSCPHLPKEIHVRRFIHFFHQHVTDQNHDYIRFIYETNFNKLTEIYFEKSPWPEPDYVASLVDGDQVFLILYKELYYRHIYNKLKPTLEDHFESYFNYCDLFNYILNTDEPVPLSLPNQWLWDIIDEFIYQFQAFSQYQSKLLKKGEEEVETLRANTKIWNVHSVLNVLYSLVEKSKINQQLARYNQGGDPDSVAGEFGIHPLYKMLGYFSLIGLLRLHSQLGDYVQAFKVLENVELNKKSLYSNIPACQITTYYYVGFAYLMMKRYQDAIRSFSNILLYIQSTKNVFQTKSYQYEQIMKKNDQMYVLLAICLTLYPQQIDEYIHSQLREKNADRLQQLQHGDLQTFEESFSYACPKFIFPVPPNFDAPPANFNRINGSHETEPDYVARLVDGDQVFLILYKELYYRHIYNKLKPTLEHRFESYFNYCDLFNYILNTDEPVPLSLPNQWLWDIIDEFIYQFQAFSQYRSELLKKGEEKVETLRANTKIWNVHSVLNVLYSLVEKSKINQQLARYNQGGDPDSVAGEFGIHPLYKMLGYFSLIGLLRLHSQLGDYVQAFKVLENVELNKKSLYSNVPACQITTYYYVGFAYLMMKRYQDAIRSFSNILLYIQSTKNMFQTKSYQYEQIMKKNDQMYVLLAICLSLYPQRIDEYVHSQLREKNADRLQQLQHGDSETFKESFSYACPKFISPVPPNFDAPPANFNREPFHLQLKVFMNEVLQQSLIPVIRSYLKLYPTMPIAKLAAFLNMDESQLRTQLLCFKHKQRNLVWTKGTNALEGDLQSSSEVDFYINQDMIHIADTKVERWYEDFFIKQIHKFEEVTRKIQAFSNT